MNPFEASGAGSGSWLVGRLRDRGLLIALLLSLGIGLGLVAWRTRAEAGHRRARARAEARAVALVLESQIDRATAAAELLGSIVREEGHLLNFQKTAAEVFAAHPGIDSIELQPGGIVADVYPRTGNERVLGFNSLRHPAYRSSANAARQRRSITVAGPLRLSRGATGLIVLVPVYTRASDRPESFWGFVTASVAFPEMLARARVNELTQQGYDSIVFLPGAADQPLLIVAESGHFSVDRAIQQPVRAGNLELRVGVSPHGGWVNQRALTLECAAVLLLSGLICFTLILLTGRDELIEQAAKARQQLADSSTDRRQFEAEHDRVQESADATQAELLQARSALQEGERAKSDLQARLDEATRLGAEMDRTVGDLRNQLDETRLGAEQAAQARESERGRADTSLRQTEQTIQHMRVELEEAARAEATAQKRQEQDRATIADLHGRLDKALNSAKDAARNLEAERGRAEAGLHEAQQQIHATQTRLDEATRELAASRSAAQSRQDADRAMIAELRAQLQSRASLPIEAPKEPIATETASVPVGPRTDQAGVVQSEAAGEEVEAPNASIAPTTAVSPAELPSAKPPKPPRRKKEEPEDQMNLWGHPNPPLRSPEKEEPHVTAAALNPPAPLKDQRSEPSRASTAESAHGPTPPHAELRRAFHQILPLLTDQDPGAADCLQDNRALFRSVFDPQDYAEFQEWTRTGQFGAALERLKKTAKKHGISM